LLGPIKKKGGKEDALYAYLNQVEQKKLSLEMSRLFYVAVTRAKKTVHLSAVLPAEDLTAWQPHPDSFLKSIWGFYRSQLPNQQPPLSPSPSSESPIFASKSRNDQVLNLRRLASNWQSPHISNYPPKIDHVAPAFTLAIRNKEAAILGTVIHAALARQHLPTIPDFLNEKIIWQRKLRQLGFPEMKINEAVSIIEQALINTIKDPRGLWIFSPLHTECRYEYDLSAVLKGKPLQVILDRTFIDNHNTRWIIEFKSSECSEANLQTYQEQLLKYAQIISQKETREIRLGLYFPLSSFWKEWPADVHS
jgi:ATP-dependent helicase/nuclease subunit A